MMIIDQSMRVEDYDQFIGVMVRNEHLRPLGKIVSFGIVDDEHWRGRSVFANLDTGRKVYARDIPECQKLVDIS